MSSIVNESFWFNGPIKEAISLVNERKCIMLVYIYDESDKSEQLNSTLRNKDVQSLIEDTTVALCMEQGSDNATLFSQFYPTLAVPIVYFIKQGTIRDFGTETVTPEQLISKITHVSQMNTTLPTTSDTKESDTSDMSEVEKKKEALKRQLKEIRKERAEKEKEKNSTKETKRREEGRKLQDARIQRENRENKLYYDKIKKDRQQDELHRQKVKAQIARDRAEKSAQRQMMMNEQKKETSTSYSVDHHHSNLNIRQLDGSNIRYRFDATTTLSQVIAWINENRTDSRKPYKLLSQFPTRSFTEEEDDKTLNELHLCPSATVIMKPARVMNRPPSFYYLTEWIYALCMAIYHFFTEFFSTMLPKNRPRPIPQQYIPVSGGQRLGGEKVNEENTAKKRNPFATRIRTLENDDDEDNYSLYNGNSVNHE
ncbi:hypothetical protein BDB01DRAFT_852662 [Pilobolus umbonatus]|nr:hypothetical protein BDB01DRAFT_852662 [Pilobolus umbonatus]